MPGIVGDNALVSATAYLSTQNHQRESDNPQCDADTMITECRNRRYPLNCEQPDPKMLDFNESTPV